jgi:hypothetical protein
MECAANLHPMHKREMALFFALLVFVFGYIHQRGFTSHTPVSRLDLLHALAARHSLAIDAWATNTYDKAVVGGHYYSDKAPGAVAVAAIPFMAAAIMVKDLEAPESWLATSWVGSFLGSGVPLAIGLTLLFSWLRRKVPVQVALLTVIALGIGGMPLPYATALWSHSLVVGLVCMAVWALDLFGPMPSRKRIGLAGAALGLALASEYTAGLVVLGLFAYVAARQPRGLPVMIAAAVPALSLIPAYNWAVTGNVLVLPYTHQASFPAMREGVYAIKWPNLETMGKLMFSMNRGLFFWSPFLLLVVPGWYMLNNTDRWRLWLCLLLPVVNTLIISGRSWDWEAGFGVGPRYLCPLLPLMALPCATAMRRFPRMGCGLAFLSIGIMTVATLTDALPAPTVENPLLDLHVSMLMQGKISPNLGQLLGLSPYASMAVFYLILTAGIWWLWREAKALDAASPTPNHAP